MTADERKCAKTRVAEFKLKHPGFLESIPPVIIGAGDREVCILDATYADITRYQQFLERRIQRRKAVSVATA